MGPWMDHVEQLSSLGLLPIGERGWKSSPYQSSARDWEKQGGRTAQEHEQSIDPEHDRERESERWHVWQLSISWRREGADEHEGRSRGGRMEQGRSINGRRWSLVVAVTGELVAPGLCWLLWHWNGFGSTALVHEKFPHLIFGMCGVVSDGYGWDGWVGLQFYTWSQINCTAKLLRLVDKWSD